ncbi:uncharacterized protein ANIA_10204 [Aspergillus nidulans FGSC A4]|uniref:Nucleoside-diphosphate-sugar epimerase family protein (AFU_orthologue AFUA_6G11740) n=1 Tax=Emericella nidulans (strain FGSC A4 / ATCC 38163 / CBS 112.46 / NRRL 194 / M139) TaxID=227321 RepID=C8VM56_EMENI|nr:hypothetical protein [Aspergillus nidulans FGSC A4]CBF84864.1 TPA: nucleoside-diphosphate-sugar epimerase family protein (AFU_orthologue; AFUA_6G11740) [Aspergillus nidulans FGSC A4]
MFYTIPEYSRRSWLFMTAVTNQLIPLPRNASFEILAATRNSQSPSAQSLSRLSSNIKLVEVNLDDPAAIFHNAHRAEQIPIWGVFSVQTSVDRGGEAKSPNNPTRIPHFIHKHNIEHHLIQQAKVNDMQWLILRPTAFYENLVPRFFGIIFATCFKMALKGKPLQLVATSGIGYFAAEGFLNPKKYAGRGLSLAGDELTYDQFVEIFEQKTEQTIPSTFRPLCSLLLTLIKDMGYMFKWFMTKGTGRILLS